jgi:hypothetical protein
MAEWEPSGHRKAQMSAADTTIIAAAIAVIGTLLSPILVQYMNNRSKSQEYDLARRQRAEEREAEAEHRRHQELRTEYTELNTQVRNVVRALSDYLHLIRANKCTEDSRDVLDGVRRDYLQCYADAQMRVTDTVLAAAIEVNSALSRLYGMALRLDGFTVPMRSPETLIEAGIQETIDSAFARLEQELRPLAWKLRNTMRHELGIGTAIL